MRIVSLLPSAPEIICGLGLRDSLVGVTHECDFPNDVASLPKVTKTLIPHDASSDEIDDLVRERMESEKALYSLDMPVLESLRPDLIVTQALCDVCAVAESEVQRAVSSLPGNPPVINLEPTRLADVLEREPVAERDRFFMAMLKELGIEKGKPFKPTEQQKKILTEATLVGEAMAKANDFAKRMEDAHYVDGSHWDFATVAYPDQREEYYEQLDERAAWLYEAVTNDPAMHGQRTGEGQVYMAAYKDKDGDWLDGGVNYVLHVPPDAPAKTFWSITLYDVDTRCLLQNEQKIADRSSRMDLIKNSDGSVDIYMGPDAPKGKEQNWIPTVAGKAWFPYFRFYSPKQAFLDRTWILPDIEKAK